MTPIAIVTGSGGLIGSESVRHFAGLGFDVIGLENDMRARFFGPEASTSHVTEQLLERGRRLPLAAARHPRHRRRGAACSPSTAAGSSLIVHTAAQPSHDWAASDPQTDFTVNAQRHAQPAAGRAQPLPGRAVRLHLDQQGLRRPAELPAAARDRDRLELPEDHHWYGGIGTDMSIDTCTHSLFGVSKVAADLLVQEYGRYFGMPTVCFRGGCLTGPQHAGAAAARLPGLPDEAAPSPASRTRSSATAASRCATTSTPRRRGAFEAFQRAPRAGRRLQPRRRARVEHLDARGDRGLRADQRPPARLHAVRHRPASATTAGTSPTSRRSRPTIPTGA